MVFQAAFRGGFFVIMFFPGDLKRSFAAGKMQYLLFQVLLEVGQLNDQLTPEPSVHVRMPAGRGNTRLCAVTILCDYR
ncbi:MAG TPA: hypothetical protein DCQ92_10770 [Verrucomicrobia subdivision 3 bacterium]|nr:hypothetical protein [Limisphaerales bacterium]